MTKDSGADLWNGWGRRITIDIVICNFCNWNIDCFNAKLQVILIIFCVGNLLIFEQILRSLRYFTEHVSCIVTQFVIDYLSQNCNVQYTDPSFNKYTLIFLFIRYYIRVISALIMYNTLFLRSIYLSLSVSFLFFFFFSFDANYSCEFVSSIEMIKDGR